MVTLHLLLADSTTRTLLQRLNEFQRLQVVAALAILIVVTGLLILLIRAWSRIVRWYMHPAPATCGEPAQTDAVSRNTIDRRPRVARNDRQHWGPRR